MERVVKVLVLFVLSITLAFLVLPGVVYSQNPSIEITKLPTCRTSELLLGKVSGVKFSDYKVAVYIYVLGWWNKPTWASPLTPISSNGTWSTNVTTGGNDKMATQYAAFLVPNGYNPPLLAGNSILPPELYTNSVTNTQKERVCPLREIKFSGYTWKVKYSSGPVGPGPNYFSDDPKDVFVDDRGRLHLKIVNRKGVWYSTEVINKSVLGYGKYTFHVASPVGSFDPSVVLGLFTWDNTSSNYYYREIDMEFSRWGSSASFPNAQFVVQPYWKPENIHRFNFIEPILLSYPARSGSGSTHSFDWKSTSVTFQSSSGNLVSSWVYAGDAVPPKGNENVRINLWLFNGARPTNKLPVEVIIDRFEFIPNL